MSKNKFAAVIIAAGYSSRMNGFKPLLKFGNETAVENVVITYEQAGVDQIILVLGHRAEEIKALFENKAIRCVINENFDQGMYTSIVKGIKETNDTIDGFFIHPVDIPLVKVQTISNLMNFFEKTEKGIVYPCFSEKRGHPPLIHKRYKDTILNNDEDGGLKKLLKKHDGDALNIPVADESILMDMDTPADFEELIRYTFQTAPNDRECSALLEIFQMPENIRRHCEKVADVSLMLAEILKERGIILDTDALKAAARLHDILRIEKNHAEKGGVLLKKLGYEKIGDFVFTHRDINVENNGIITENEILYLADKLVEDDKLTDLKKRKNTNLEKFKDKPEVREKIKERYENAEGIVRKIEAITGKGLWDGTGDLFSQTW